MLIIFFIYNFKSISLDSFETAKSKEKEAEFVSSDDAKISALQNKMDLPPKRNRNKPKKYDSFEINSSEEKSSETLSGMFIVININKLYPYFFTKFILYT